MAITSSFQDLRPLHFFMTFLVLANLTWNCGTGQVSGHYRTQKPKRLPLDSRVVANGTLNSTAPSVAEGAVVADAGRND